MRFGFLGVGALSTPMLEHFLADGHEVTVWNRTRAKAEPMADLGATVVDDAADAAAPGGVVLSCLADDAALAAVLGDGAVFGRLGDGGVHVGMSTCSPAMTTELAGGIAAAGGAHLTAAVLGRPDMVRSRGHRLLCSGPAAALDRVRPILEPTCEALFPLGDAPAAASVGKLCTNLLIAANVEFMAETLALATAAGANPEGVRAMWNATLFPGAVHTNYSRQILDRDYADPLFALRLMHKDVGLFADAAHAEGLDAPLAEALRTRFRAAVHAGLGENDFTAVSALAWRQTDAAGPD